MAQRRSQCPGGLHNLGEHFPLSERAPYDGTHHDCYHGGSHQQFPAGRHPDVAEQAATVYRHRDNQADHVDQHTGDGVEPYRGGADRRRHTLPIEEMEVGSERSDSLGRQEAGEGSGEGRLVAGHRGMACSSGSLERDGSTGVANQRNGQGGQQPPEGARLDLLDGIGQFFDLRQNDVDRKGQGCQADDHPRCFFHLPVRVSVTVEPTDGPANLGRSNAPS